MTPNTLHLIYKTHCFYPYGIWEPADHESQLLALRHFTPGFYPVPYHMLAEITYVAGLHGWVVTTEGNPNSHDGQLDLGLAT